MYAIIIGIEIGFCLGVLTCILIVRHAAKQFEDRDE